MKKILQLIIALGLALGVNAQQLTNLPTVYINTENGRPIKDKENYVPSTVTICTDVEDDAITDVSAGVRGRGNSTWGMDKKPYRVKFDKKISLFNQRAKAKNWVFLANYADKTLMRNAVAFEVSRFLGFEFSPSTVFADVMLNGEYIGNYMITDQMEVNPGRVEIDEMEPTDTSGEALTGGYFLEIDGFANGEPVWFQTSHGMPITVKSPKDDEIVPEQLSYIKNYVQKFEDALFSSSFADPEKGYRSMVDEKSLIDWYIASEFTGNSDAFWSTYIYKKRSDDHIYFGPLWDFDIAFSNDDRLGDATRKLMREHAHDPRQWIRRLWQDPWMRSAVNERWQQLVADGLVEHILAYIDELEQMLDVSQQLNFERWPVLNRKVYREVFLFPTYAQGVDRLRRYVSERAEFLTESFTTSTTPLLYDTDKAYKIRHYSTYYLTCGYSITIDSRGNDGQTLRFVQAPGMPEGVYNIKAENGRLVGSDHSWNAVYLDDPADAYAQFQVEKSDSYGGQYLRILNMGQCAYLGVDSNSPRSPVYTDKSGDDVRHHWKIEVVETDGIADALGSDCALQVAGSIVTGAGLIEVYDTTGRRVLSGHGSVDGSQLSPGFYVVRCGAYAIKAAF